MHKPRTIHGCAYHNVGLVHPYKGYRILPILFRPLLFINSLNAPACRGLFLSRRLYSRLLGEPLPRYKMGGRKEALHGGELLPALRTRLWETVKRLEGGSVIYDFRFAICDLRFSTPDLIGGIRQSKIGNLFLLF